MNSTSYRCAGCKYLRRRCPSDCILSPYFPPNNPQRFYYVHRIYGASNVGKMLQQVPVDQRAEAANSMYYEAYCRIKDPVYGCVGIITHLNQQIYEAQCELARIESEIAVLNNLIIHPQTELPISQQIVTVAPSFPPDDHCSLFGHIGTFSSTYDLSTPQFY